jgi:hypothetical protein
MHGAEWQSDGETGCRSRPGASVCADFTAAVQRGWGSGRAFSGPRSRGTARGDPPGRLQHRRRCVSAMATANGSCARPPEPPALPGAAASGMEDHARPSQGGGGACGRRPPSRSADSRSPGRCLPTVGVEASALEPTWQRPASVGRRTRAPPPPGCSGRGARGHRRVEPGGPLRVAGSRAGRTGSACATPADATSTLVR